MSCIINENYNRVVSALRVMELSKMDPHIALTTGLTAFLWLMIENPEQYHAFMLSGIDVADSNSDGKSENDDETIGMLANYDRQN